MNILLLYNEEYFKQLALQGKKSGLHLLCDETQDIASTED